MGVRLVEEGDRIYLDGKVFDYKDMIKQAGGQWDNDRRMWYFDASQMEVARDVVRTIPDPVHPEAEIIGQAVYKEKTYGVLWAGETKTGRQGLKLAFHNGSDSFWVDAEKASFKAFDKPIKWEEYKDMVKPDDNVIGKATYKDKSYAVLHVYEGKDGSERLKLAMSNGKTFWVDKSAVSEYQEYKKPVTWNRLQDFLTEKKATRETGDSFAGASLDSGEKGCQVKRAFAPGM